MCSQWAVSTPQALLLTGPAQQHTCSTRLPLMQEARQPSLLPQPQQPQETTLSRGRRWAPQQQAQPTSWTPAGPRGMRSWARAHLMQPRLSGGCAAQWRTSGQQYPT